MLAVFLGGPAAQWWGGLVGLGIGIQESIIPAAVVADGGARSARFRLRPLHLRYGAAWVLGSVVIGFLFSVSLGAVTALRSRRSSRRSRSS